MLHPCAHRAAATSWRPAVSLKAPASRSAPPPGWRRCARPSSRGCLSNHPYLAHAARMRERLGMNSASPSVQATDIPPELNPRLDRAALTEDFARAGRIHIPNILTEVSAVRVFRALQQETRWTLTLNKGSDFLDI